MVSRRSSTVRRAPTYSSRSPADLTLYSPIITAINRQIEPVLREEPNFQVKGLPLSVWAHLKAEKVHEKFVAVAAEEAAAELGKRWAQQLDVALEGYRLVCEGRPQPDAQPRIEHFRAGSPALGGVALLDLKDRHRLQRIVSHLLFHSGHQRWAEYGPSSGKTQPR